MVPRLLLVDGRFRAVTDAASRRQWRAARRSSRKPSGGSSRRSSRQHGDGESMNVVTSTAADTEVTPAVTECVRSGVTDDAAAENTATRNGLCRNCFVASEFNAADCLGWATGRASDYNVKSRLSVCWWRRFVWSLARLTAAVVTTASVILSFGKTG